MAKHEKIACIFYPIFDLPDQQGPDGFQIIPVSEKSTWEWFNSLSSEDQDHVNFRPSRAMNEDYPVETSITISPIGVHLDLTGPSWTKFFSPEEFPMRYIVMSLVLQNGDVITFDDMNLESHGDSEDDRHKANLAATYEEPIPLDHMKELVICGSSISVSDYS